MQLAVNNLTWQLKHSGQPGAVFVSRFTVLSLFTAGTHKAAFAANATLWGYSGTGLQSVADNLLLIPLMMTLSFQGLTEKECKHHNEVSLCRIF